MVLRRGWIYLLLLLAAAGLQARFWWGDGGYRQAQQVQAKAALQRAENARLQLRNDALSAEVDDLKAGESAVEERARSELGMIKPGETFYRVVPATAETSQAENAITPADADAAGTRQ